MDFLQDAALGHEESWVYDALSLILFVHLASAGDADQALATTEFNRTHHRILFLVAHKPGVTVGEIVVLLRLTAQAIQPPLKLLIEKGLVKQQSSERDRRKRHLIITEEGRAFLESLTGTQFQRLENARRRAGDESFEGFLRVMRALTTDSDRQWLYTTTGRRDAYAERGQRKSANEVQRHPSSEPQDAISS